MNLYELTIHQAAEKIRAQQITKQELRESISKKDPGS